MSQSSNSLAGHTTRPTLSPVPLLVDASASADVAGDIGHRWPRRPTGGSALPLIDVACAVTAAARGLVPSCTAALVTRVGRSWQILAQNGPADVIGYHRRELASLDLGRCGITLSDQHLVAGLDTRGAAICLVLVAAHGREVPVRAPDLLQSILDCAAEKLDEAAALQRRDRAIRRMELLRGQGQEAGLRSMRDLEDLVASLWPLATVRYLSRDAALGLERRLRRIIGEACTTGNVAVDATSDDPNLRTPDWTHRVAVPVSKHGALLIEPAAAGEMLDEETVAAAAVAARMWSLVERQETLEADLRSHREEDGETGCLTGASLPKRLDGALQSPAAGGQAAVLLLQIDQLNAATDMALAGRIGQLLAAGGRAGDYDVFRLRPWRYAVVVPGATVREARALAQRLRLAVRQFDGTSCSASVGLALAPAHGSTAGELIDAAEHAMHLVAAEGGDAEEPARQRGRSRLAEAGTFRRIEALRTLATLADELCHGGLAHSHAVAQRATRIAIAMGLDRQTVLAVQLAGELHEIGALFVESGDDEGQPTAVRALLSSRLLRTAGLEAASDVVAAMHERMDGSGVPEHQQGVDISIGARILAVANAFETIVDGLGQGDRGVDSAVGHLREQSGTSFDPRVVAIALTQATDARSVEA